MGQVWLAARADGLYQRRVALKLLRPGLADPQPAPALHPRAADPGAAGASAHRAPARRRHQQRRPALPRAGIRRRRADHRLLPQRTRWRCDTRLRLFLQVCDAVSHAHANLIVHRDLKPSNILVTPAARCACSTSASPSCSTLRRSRRPSNTRTGVRAFTLHYAAPEQVRGEPVTTMTDVYSLGVVLYELLTDTKPYRLKRQTDAEWEEAILAADPHAAIAGAAAPCRRQRRRRARRCAGARARSPATSTTSCSRRWPSGPSSAIRRSRRWRWTCSRYLAGRRCRRGRRASAIACGKYAAPPSLGAGDRRR